jgi:DNA helicase II / ATP-dependent DNA helicase PcrA
VDRERIFEGLNPEQRRAVEAVRGPVCILAGAGSGKTTTITRRIAWQVASGTFRPEEILAVTFTDKAAGEMRERLGALGARGVRASTFHAAALGQLRRLSPSPPERIAASKALPLRHIANSLPRPYRFRPAGDLATEIEWAKNRRIPPGDYRASLDGHEPPIPPDLMERVYHTYERRKRDAGWVDFEDLLELAIRLLDEDGNALMEVRSRYTAFTVDEYQDVNLLQQTLLERWLGERDDLCVVGDDFQSIYSFTGAGPEHLLATPERFPHAPVVRLEHNYRSTPEVLGLANRLVPGLGGAEKVLRAARPGGPEPVVRPFATPEAEAAWVAERVRALREEGVPLEESAVLCRTNARLADFEEAFHEAEIPFQGAALLQREAARMLLRRLRDLGASVSVHFETRRLAEEAGWLPQPPEKLGERELVRQNDLARLVRLAESFEDGTRTAAEFVAELERRFGSGGAERCGVHLLTLHGSKGLEFEAVFIPRVEEKELPIKLARTSAELAEERRLLYVGLTRAKRHLAVTWSGRPSRFLTELGVAPTVARAPTPDDPLFDALRAWRRDRARAEDVPAYVVFHDSTLAEIAGRRPRTLGELAHVPGVGPAKLGRYGSDVLATLAAAVA